MVRGRAAPDFRRTNARMAGIHTSPVIRLAVQRDAARRFDLHADRWREFQYIYKSSLSDHETELVRRHAGIGADGREGSCRS